MEKKPTIDFLIYVAVNLIDLKTKYFKDRRGLEQKEWDFWIFISPFFFLTLTLTQQSPESPSRCTRHPDQSRLKYQGSIRISSRAKSSSLLTRGGISWWEERLLSIKTRPAVSRISIKVNNSPDQSRLKYQGSIRVVLGWSVNEKLPLYRVVAF